MDNTVFDDRGSPALYAGGDFTTAGGKVSAYFAKWSPVDPAFGDLDGDCAVNLFDLFCVLDAFSDVFKDCEPFDVDIEPCGGNGTINLQDLFAVLNAFNGIDPCCGS